MTTEAKTDIYVGKDVGRHDHVIAPEMVAQYSDAVDDANPMYTGTSPFGGPVAPALLFHSEVYSFRARPAGQPVWYLPNLYGNLHAKQEWDLFRPMLVGDHVSTRSFICDRYIKRGRDYVVNEVLFFDAEGRVAARQRTHQSFLRETTDGVVVDKSREKSSARRFEVDTSSALETIEGRRKAITPEMCWKFSGPVKNYHNDRDEALKLGFPDVVVQGMMSTCFLSEMMTDRFGAGWFAGGRMNVNLVNVVWGSDVLRCRGFVREITPEGDRRRAHLDVWAEKEDGTKVTIGAASAVID